ncbi:MAG: MFS transporter [Opitutaceae bacterium]|nr:MFS transporter [Opitutaceae bacterium]
MVSARLPNRWLLPAFLAVAAGLNFGDRAALSAVLAAIRNEFGSTDIALGLLGSAFLWSYALASPFAGSLADRYSRSRLILASLLTWSVVTLLVGLAHNYPMLLALRFALGLTECLFLPAAVALVADHHGAETRARALSLLTIGIQSGMVCGSTFSGWMADIHGWRSGFLVLGSGGIVLAILGQMLFQTRRIPSLPGGLRQKARSPFEAIRYLARVRSYQVLIVESLLSGFGMWVFFAWLPLYFRDTFNMSLAAAGFAGTFMLQVAVVMGTLVGGWFSDFVAGQAPHRRMALYGTFYLLASPFLLLFLGRPELPVLVAGISLFAFFRGVGQSNDNPTQCEVVPSQFRSTGVGIMNAVSTAAGGCGVFAAGYLKREIGLDMVFAGLSAIFALAGFMLLIGYRFFMRADIARAQTTAHM